VAAKHVLRYLRGTVEYGLSYIQGNGVKLMGFTDANLTGRSGVVYWFGRKQKSVALNSIEAEYMATSLAACEAIWLRKLLMGLFGQELETIVIQCNNQSCIKLSEVQTH
jgi:hypothetical protein